MKETKTLLHILMHIGRLLEQTTSAKLTDLGLHHGQGRTLCILKNNGPLTQADLARGMDVRPATITNILRPLESRGLIKRYTDPATNRAVVVTLTTAGITAAQAVQQAWDLVEADLIAAIPVTDRPVLFQHLEVLRDSLGGSRPEFKTYKEQ